MINCKLDKAFNAFILFTCVVLLASCSNDDTPSPADFQRHISTATSYADQGQFKAAIFEARNAITASPSDPKGYLTLGEMFLTLGAYRNATTILMQSPEKTADINIVTARAYNQLGKYNSAVETLNKVNNKDEQLERYLTTLAESQLGLRDFTAFNTSIDQLQKSFPDGAHIQLLQSQSLAAQGKIQEAIETASKVSEKDAEVAVDAMLLAGRIALNTNQLEQAEKFLNLALERLPDSDILTIRRAQALQLMTETLIRLGRSAEANIYQKLLAEANPSAEQANENFERALTLLNQGKISEATSLLEETQKTAPGHQVANTLLGLLYLNQGDLEKGNALINQYLDAETATPQLIQSAALTQISNNSIDEAIKLLTNAVANNQDNPQLLATYGVSLLSKDETDKTGAEALEKAISLNPELIRAKIPLARHYLAIKETVKAELLLQEAFTKAPEDTEVQDALFSFLINEKGLDSVKTLLVDPLLSSYPEQASSQIQAARYYYQAENLPQAEIHFQNTLKYEADSTVALAGLAAIYDQTENWSKAVVAYQNLITANPDIAAAYSRYLSIQLQLQKINEGIRFLEELATNSDSWQPNIILSQFHLQNNAFPQAEKWADLSASKLGNDQLGIDTTRTIFISLSGVYQNQNQIDKARTAAARSLQVDPGNWRSLIRLAEIEIAAKNITEAENLLGQINETEESRPAKIATIAKTLAAKDDNLGAIELMTNLWSEAPSENLAKNLYALLNETNQVDKAENFLQDWGEKVSDSSTPIMLLALKADQARQITEAITLYETALERNPNTIGALNNLSWIMLDSDPKKSLELSSRAFELAPNDPSILDTYGLGLLRNGEKEKAISVLKVARKLSPNNPDIQEHLKQAQEN